MTKSIFILILLAITKICFSQTVVQPVGEITQQNYTISGYIRSSENGEALIGATVQVKELYKGSMANAYGFYSLTLPGGKHSVQYSYLGNLSKTFDIELTGDLINNVELQQASVEIAEVVISGEAKNKNIKAPEMSVVKISPKDVVSIPVIFGEQDILKTIQLMPGVKSAGEGNSGFYVRGGVSDQNLIILDEAPVYSSSHLLGFFSVFNSDAVISLTDNAGTIANFTEVEPGTYSGKSLLTKSDIGYTLNIVSEGKTYSANATIPQRVNIDSLTSKYNPKSIIYEVGYVVSCHFSDPGEFRNYYRVKTYKISDRTKAKNSKDIYNDDLCNGNRVVWPWSYEVYQQADTVVVELYTIDVHTYDYYKTLFSISGGAEMMSFTTPANPTTNISNGALGYFGAYSISRDTIIISTAR